MCQMILDMQWAFGRYLVTGVKDRPSTDQPTRSLHVNRVCLVRIAVDEWTVAGRVDCGMLCRVKSALREDIHVELELFLSHSGNKNYGGAKLGVK